MTTQAYKDLNPNAPDGIAILSMPVIEATLDSGSVAVTSSALPTGAATAAKQPALGTAGTASADVLTVQGKSGMTALDVVPKPLSARVSTSDTNVAAGTRRTFTSGTYTQGFYFVNNNAAAEVYIGDPSTVSSTVYDFKLLPGELSAWLPFANPNVFGWDTSVTAAVLRAVGG